MDSTVIWSWDGEKINREISWKVNNSLGYFYGAFTVFLGYKFCNGESKVMGLAPYGEKNQDIFNVFDEIIKTDDNGYDVTEISIPMTSGYLVGIKRIEDLFGIKRRLPEESFKKEHKDLAYTLQFYLEKIGMNLARQAIKKTGSNNLCMTGGVALNCKMNKKIMELPEVEKLFIQPVANDGGLVIGGVLEASKRFGYNPRFNMKHNYWGPSFSNKEIKNILDERRIVYSMLSNLKIIAQKLAVGKFVGWFQGKMEMGPRALGNRSVLCDPRRNDLKDKLNDYVKHREKWRPYAPSILEEYADEYIINYNSAPFMIKTFDVKEELQKNIEGVLHPKDRTTRPHVVCKDVNLKYWELINEFRKITGIPILLNTSFNDHGEPIVCSPQDAIKDFFGTGLDILVLNNFVLSK
jgi:carbamoyltransferase